MLQQNMETYTKPLFLSIIVMECLRTFCSSAILPETTLHYMDWKDFLHPDVLNATDADQSRYDSEMFEGDISGFEIGQMPAQAAANAVDDTRLLWPNNTVPYEFSAQRFASFALSEHKRVEEAMQLIMTRTGQCITFAPRTNEKDYVRFRKGMQPYSDIGRTGDRQVISLSSACLSRYGCIQHEIMHALGFYHEQSRADRDDYVLVNFDNIADSAQVQFEKHTAGLTYNLPYDFESVMHYEYNAFAKNTSVPTILPRSGRWKLGQQEGLSPLDAVFLSSIPDTELRFTSSTDHILRNEGECKDRRKRCEFIDDEKRRWPDGTVPFLISPFFRRESKKVIRDAIEVFMLKTPLKFRERTSADKDYLYIAPGLRCSSFTGMEGEGKQVITLRAPDCLKRGFIQHELMLAAGFYPEIRRTDRDDYIEINWKNIAAEYHHQLQNNIDKDITAFGKPYDFASILHFGPHEFAVDPKEWTIRPRENKTHFPGVAQMGQELELSEIDVAKIKLAYPIETGTICPSGKGWTKFQNICYFFSFFSDTQPSAFGSARTFCREMNARITSEPNGTVADFFRAQMYLAALESSAKIYVGICNTISPSEREETRETDCTPQLHFICSKRLSVV